MGFGSFKHDIKHAADSTADDARKAADTTAHGATKAADTTAHGATKAADTTADGVQSVTVDMATVPAPLKTVVGDAASAYDSAVHQVEDAIARLGKEVLQGKAESVFKEYKTIIQELFAAWPDAIAASGDDNPLGLLKDNALKKINDSSGAAALQELAGQLEAPLAAAAAKGISAFGVSFGVSAAAGAGFEASVGFAGDLPVTKVEGYGFVGITLGAAEGASVGTSAVLRMTMPSSGPGIAIVIQGDEGIGGGVTVFFSLEGDFSGFLISFDAGEEISVSGGFGQMYVFGGTVDVPPPPKPNRTSQAVDEAASHAGEIIKDVEKLHF